MFDPEIVAAINSFAFPFMLRRFNPVRRFERWFYRKVDEGWAQWRRTCGKAKPGTLSYRWNRCSYPR